MRIDIEKVIRNEKIEEYLNLLNTPDFTELEEIDWNRFDLLDELWCDLTAEEQKIACELFWNKNEKENT